MHIFAEHIRYNFQTSIHVSHLAVFAIQDIEQTRVILE